MEKDKSFKLNMIDVLGRGATMTLAEVPFNKNPLTAAAEHVLERYNQGKVEDAISGIKAYHVNRNIEVEDPLLGASFSKAASVEIPGKGTAFCSLDVPSRLREKITDAQVTAECSLPNGETGTASQPRANRSSMISVGSAAP